MDLFFRPTASPLRLGRWLAELGRTTDGLVRAFGPGTDALEPRSRERVILAVSEVNGCRYTAWVHGSWHDLLGAERADDSLPALLDYARDSALAGRPADTADLEAVLSPEAVRAIRATVAVAELSSLVGNTADGLAERAMLKRPVLSPQTLSDLLVVGLALPWALPIFAATATMRLVSWAAPPMPVLIAPPDDEANLVVHMLADAIPQYLSHAATRALVLRLPGPLSVGVRAEGTEATVRVSRDRIELENGLSDDTFLVVDGGLELLLDVAARTISREVSGLPVRRFR